MKEIHSIMNITNGSLVFIVLVILVKDSNAANILGIYQFPSFSHQQPFLVLSYALAKKGHSLTILTTNPSKKPVENVTEIDLSSLYDDMKELQKHGQVSFQGYKDSLQQIWELYATTEYLNRVIIDKPIFKQFLRDVNGTKYDLILTEAFTYTSLLAVREIIGRPPIVSIGTAHPYMVMDEPYGNPFSPSYIPNVFLEYDEKMNLWQRFRNLCTHLYSLYILYWGLYPLQDKYMKELFGDLPYTAKELEFNKSLSIYTVDIATGYPRPLQPNTVFVGPLHVDEKPMPLSKDLKKWMDEAEEGVIYFSMGSNMQGTSVPDHVRAAFIRAFQKLPKVRILWKWEADRELPGKPDNVLVKKWLPQKSIFAHPKLKVFITQCGIQSVQEAIHREIPVLGVPLFFDQFFNLKKLTNNGAALKLNFNEINYQDVYLKLKALLTDPSYKENMRRLSALTRDKPMSPIDTAIWWVEYVLRHNGAPHVRPASLDLTWYQYYMVDIFLIIVVLVSIFFYVFGYIVKKIVLSFNFYNISRNDKVKLS